MKKRLFSLFMITILAASTVGCAGTTVATQVAKANTSAPEQADSSAGSAVQAEEAAEAEETTTAAAAAAGTLEECLKQIEADFDTVISGIQEKQQALYTAAGDTYDGYKASADQFADWYSYVNTETAALYTRTEAAMVNYYHLVADTVEHDSDGIDEALEEANARISEGCYEKLYTEVYDNSLSTLFDRYNDGIFSDVPDGVDSDEWCDVESAFTDLWCEQSDIFFDGWQVATSDFNDLWFEMVMAMEMDLNYNVDEIYKTYQDNKAAAAAEEAAAGSEEVTEEETQA